jgi:hypothetical protein
MAAVCFHDVGKWLSRVRGAGGQRSIRKSSRTADERGNEDYKE